MAIRVPVYERQVGQASVPNVRAPSFAGQAGQNVRALGQGIVTAAKGVADVIQSEMDANDFAAFQQAKVDAANARLDAGVVLDSKHGVDAMRESGSIAKQFDEKLDEIGKGLNPRLAEKWVQLRNSESVGFKRGVARKVGDEGEKLQAQVYDAALQTNVRKAVSLFEAAPNETTVLELNALHDDAVTDARARAAHLGVTKEIREEMELEATDPLFAAAIDGALARNDWREAEQTLQDRSDAMAAETVRKAEGLIKAKKQEMIVEDASDDILAAADNNLLAALDMLDEYTVDGERLEPEIRKDVRDSITSKYRVRDLAVRESEEPAVGKLLEDMYRLNISPFDNSQVGLLAGISEERRGVLAARERAHKRARTAERNDAMRTKIQLFSALRFNRIEDIPDPNDDTEAYFENVDEKTLATMKSMYANMGRLSTQQRAAVNRRLQSYVTERVTDEDEADKLVADAWLNIDKVLDQNNGRLPEGQLYDAVEPVILQHELQKQTLGWPFRSEEESVELAREDAEQHLKQFRPTFKPVSTLPKDVTSDEVDELRQGAARRLNKTEASVTSDDVINMYNELLKTGKVQ